MDERHDYDVVVVGAGPGGLCAAAYLATAGRRVLVVDARDQAGGHMSAFTHANYEFDIGLHYTARREAEHLLGPLGVHPTFREFDPDAMFRLHGPGREVAVPRGLETFRARLHAVFPDETTAVDGFLDTCVELAGEMEQVPDRPHLRELPQLPWRLRGLLRHARSTAGGYLDTLHASPALKNALLGWSSGSVAVAPSRLSLPVAAALVTSYLGGLSYPQGGSSVITAGMADTVRRHGGEIVLGTETSHIIVADGKVCGVRLRPASLDSAPGPEQEVLAPAVVSAIDPRQTYGQLLAPEVVPERLLRRVAGYEMALPLAVLYLVLDRDLAREGFPNTSHVIAGSENADDMYAALRAGELPRDNAVGVFVANLADPDNPRLCAPGQTNVQLIGLAPAHHAWWGVTPGGGSTERYRARKREVRDLMLARAEHVVPGITDAIVFEELGTPVTGERFLRAPDGTSYGPAFTPRQVLTRLGPASPVEGLFHAGAATRAGHGLTGTLTGGLAAASAVTTIPVAELMTRSARQEEPAHA